MLKTKGGKQFIEMDHWIDEATSSLVIYPIYGVRFDILSKWFEKFSMKNLQDQRDRASIAFSGDMLSMQDKFYFNLNGEKYATDFNELQAKVLYKIGADRVVFPERDMGVRVAHNLVSDNILDHIELDPEYSIVEIVTPTSWVGKTLVDLELRARYEITVLAIKNGKSINVTPAPDEELKAGSILVVIGQSSNISSITSENKDIIRRK